MSLRDARKAIGKTVRRSNICKLVLLRNEQLDADDRATLQEWLTDKAGITSAEIARALREEGHDISVAAVRRHRNQDCSCGTL